MLDFTFSYVENGLEEEKREYLLMTQGTKKRSCDPSI